MRKGVTITSGITANNKVYDGTKTATISSNNVVLNGVVAGDAPNVRLSTNGYAANFASTNIGTGIAVTVTGLTLTGAGATNYTLTQPVGLTANITAVGVVMITSGINANNKVYDGTTTATISSNNVILYGVRAGDAATVRLSTNGYTATFTSAGAANGIGVTISGLTLTGAGATNYTLTQPAGLTANITNKSVMITSGISTNNKVYDGTTAATISSNNVVLNGVLAGDAPNVRLSTNGYAANFASPNVGTGIVVTVTGLTLTGASATNYTLSQPTLAANITSVMLTARADNKSRTYGLTNPPFTVSYNGFVNNEGTNVLTGTPSLNTSATTNSLPGTYTIIAGAGTLNATNYNFAFINGTLTVVALPRLTNVLLNGKFILAWPTVAGQTYQLEYKDNLSAATWIFSGDPFVGTGNPIIATNNLGASPQRFFRLEISP
jgi:hypothetical protein